MNSDSPAQNGLRGSVMRGIGWVAVEKWGLRLMSLIVFVILLRTIDAAEFGLASFTTSITMILLVFVDAGFPKALIQKKELDPDDAPTAFWTALGLATVIYTLLFFAAPLVSDLMDMPELDAMLRVLGLALYVTALSSVPTALLERDLNFRSLGLRSIFGTAVGAAIAVPMALFGMGVWALIAQTLGTLTAGAVALWFATSWRPTFRFSFSSLKRLATFGISVMGLELLNRLQQNTDKLLINIILGPAAGGIYFVGQRAVKVISDLVSSVISKVALTTFSKLQDDRPRLNRAFLQLTFAAGAIAIPLFGILAVHGDIILPYVAGEGDWAEAVPVMQILAVSSALAAMLYFDKQTLLAVGEPRRALVLGLVENIVGIALLVIAAPFGIVAIALGRVARLILVWPYRMHLLQRYASITIGSYVFNVAMLVAAFAVPVGVAVVAWMTPWRDVSPAFWAFAAPTGAIMLAVYYGGLWLLCGRTNRDVIRKSLKFGRR